MRSRLSTTGGSVTALVAVAALALALPGGSAGAAATGGFGASFVDAPLQANLSENIAADTHRIGALQPGIERLDARLDRLQSDIDEASAQLAQTRTDLEVARARLELLQTALARDQRVLSRQLVQLYEAGSQDWTTVVLESKGFTDLLERTDFSRRIAHRSAQIVGRVRRDRAAVRTAEARLTTLEASQTRAVNTLVAARSSIAEARDQLVTRQTKLRGERRRLRARLARIAGVTSQALSAAGLATFSGIAVAAWIHPILVYAAAHGWDGQLVQYDGFRSYADQQAVQGMADIAATPGMSRHEGTQWPDGAIDIPNNAGGFNAIVNGSGSPYRGQLLWRASEGDPVHFSSPQPVPGKGY
jgi:peptidoglycan hydrolase CwlO-like protein